jgi:hypothetical protein
MDDIRTWILLKFRCFKLFIVTANNQGRRGNPYWTIQIVESLGLQFRFRFRFRLQSRTMRHLRSSGLISSRPFDIQYSKR